MPEYFQAVSTFTPHEFCYQIYGLSMILESTQNMYHLITGDYNMSIHSNPEERNQNNLLV